MRAFRSLAILLGAAGLVRCSLLLDTNQLTAAGDRLADGSADGDAHPDAASSDGDAGEDSPGDSKPGDSGGLEAGDSEAQAGTYCETLVPKPTLCSDFDNVDFPAGWDTLSVWGKCKATLDTTLYVSPPRSFRATSPLFTTTGGCSSTLQRKFPAPQSSLVIDFDLLIVARDTGSTLDLVSVSMPASGGTEHAVLRLTPWAAEIKETVDLADGGTLYGGHPLPEIPSLGTWSHIHWSIDLTGTNATSNVTMNGVTTGDSLHMKDFLADPQISIGIGYVGAPADPCDFVFDNIVVDIK